MKLRWLAIALIPFLVATWWFTRDTLPDPIRIGTAHPGGLYKRFGVLFAKDLKAITGHEVELVRSAGSPQNIARLVAGTLDLAIVQLSSLHHEDLVVAAPLYDEALHVLVRRGRGIAKLGDLAGRRISIGPEGSGMREAATGLLRHHGIDPAGLKDNGAYFRRLLEDDSFDGAIVVAGSLNPDLRAVMKTGRYVLMPVEGADALAQRDPHVRSMEIPRGFFVGSPPLPPAPVRTVGTVAVLAARRDVDKKLVEAAAQALYEGRVRNEIGSIYPPSVAKNWDAVPVHRGLGDYFDPWNGVQFLGSIFEGLAGFYELIVAIFAGAYLLYRRKKFRREEENQRRLKIEHERLDTLLDETVRIEREQMDCTDTAQLEKFLDEITLIKLRALEDLSHEELRGDPRFLIFLTQCHNLIRKIQTKIAQESARR